MPRFSPSKYNPAKDSSPGSEIYRYNEGDEDPGCEGVILLVEKDQCLCGCGEYPKGKDAKFCMGHDARYRGILQRAHMTGTEINVFNEGTLVSGPAMSFARDLGWEEHILTSEKVNADRIRRANERLLKKATGPQVGDRKLIKVGRWDYTGQVVAIYEDKGEIVYEYVTKKGETKTHTVAKEA